MTTVQPGSFLTLHYRLAGPAGDVINTFDDKPATLTLGNSELSPALEQRLLGMEEGARTSFELAAGEAFGPRNPEMQQWVARQAAGTRWATPTSNTHIGEAVPPSPTPDGSRQLRRHGDRRWANADRRMPLRH
jgi:FKBP-type peptidyl-prolyl cis-trans isomerase SlpA